MSAACLDSPATRLLTVQPGSEDLPGRLDLKAPPVSLEVLGKSDRKAREACPGPRESADPRERPVDPVAPPSLDHQDNQDPRDCADPLDNLAQSVLRKQFRPNIAHAE